MKLVNREGQSLVEVLIGLAIGALLIGTAALGVAFTLRSSTATQNLRSGSELSQELLDKVRSFAGANWLNIYNLTKGTSTQYFLNASGSDFIAVQGKESKLDNDVLSGLVAHWKFDEVETSTSTTTYDASGNNNSGTLTNGTARASSTCKLANCLDFDGLNDYVTVTNSASIRGASSTGSIAAWVNLDFVSSTGLHAIVDVDGTGCTSRGLFFYLSNTQFKLQYGGGGACRQVNSVTAPATGKWFHVVATWDSSGGKIYVNGVQEGSNTNAPDFSIAQANTYIGSNGGTTRFIDGRLDDVRIYNRALSSDEIKRLYQSSAFTRYFSVENVCRTNDASSTISGVAPCVGSDIDDPSTQKITVKTEWTTQAGKLAEVKLIDFITRWQNRVLRQTDWSQGVGPPGPIIDPTGQYSSSSNIDATSTPGSIQIKELTPT